MDEIVRQIYKDTYNFYLKWKNISTYTDWPILIQEAGEIHKKYPYQICKRILLELVEIIEAEFMEKG